MRQAIGRNPRGFYALAADYDAEPNGTFDRPVIRPLFEGTLEGLGNAISNLSIDDSKDDRVGLFYETYYSRPYEGIIRDLRLLNANVTGTHLMANVGALVGDSEGEIANCYVTGLVSATRGNAGGIVGWSSTTTIVNSIADVQVSASKTAGGLVGFNEGRLTNTSSFGVVSSATGAAGGLVGVNDGSGAGHIQNSYSTAQVSGPEAGGLVGSNYFGVITNSYATGSADGSTSSGGLAGSNIQSIIQQSYSISAVKDGSEYKGGFVGDDDGGDTDNYWDLDTSGVSNPNQGCGNRADCSGVTGLTDDQMKSGLPIGFDPAIWGQKKSINNGYPYLLANPPPQ